MINGEQEVGTLSVLRVNGLTLAIWNNGDLFCTAQSGRAEPVQAFVEAVAY